MAVPGCPFPTFSTASAASTRAVLTARSSIGSQLRSVTFPDPSERARSPPTAADQVQRTPTGVRKPCPTSPKLGLMQEAVATPAAESVGPASRSRIPFGRKVLAYVALTKPRVIELLLVTTAPVMVLA